MERVNCNYCGTENTLAYTECINCLLKREWVKNFPPFLAPESYGLDKETHRLIMTMQSRMEEDVTRIRIIVFLVCTVIMLPVLLWFYSGGRIHVDNSFMLLLMSVGVVLLVGGIWFLIARGGRLYKWWWNDREWERFEHKFYANEDYIGDRSKTNLLYYRRRQFDELKERLRLIEKVREEKVDEDVKLKKK